MSKSESSAVFSTIVCLLLMATGFLMASFSIPYSFVPYLLAILVGARQTVERRSIDGISRHRCLYHWSLV